jgi:hypothetical protein
VVVVDAGPSLVVVLELVDVLEVVVLVEVVVEVELEVEGDDAGVVAGATPVSGEVQLAGAVETPAVPGISTVPAQPNDEKCASSVTVPPSENETVDEDSRMNPDASTEIRSRMLV